MADRQDMMRKVRALLDKAQSTTFEPERDEALRLADRLVTAYTIEAWELELAKPVNSREKPVLVEYEYPKTGDWTIDDHLANIFGSLSRHCRVKLGFYGNYRAKIVGYQSDIDYLDMLFTNIYLHLSVNMIPHATRDLSYIENIASLKEAGWKWQKIYEQMVPVFPEKFPEAHVRPGYETSGDIVVNGQHFTRLYTTNGRWGVRLTKEYSDYIKSTPDRERVGNNPDQYRRSFLAGYENGIRRRLSDLDGEVTNSMALVLRGREEDLLEELYKLFPDKRPHPADCDCDIHHRCQDPACQRLLCVAARKPLKFSEARMRIPREDAAARRRGEAAAKNADLQGGRHNLAPRKQLDG